MIEYKRAAKERKKKRKKFILIFILVVLCLFAIAFFACTVKEVEVSGNENYSDSEIVSAVMSSEWDYNTLYLLYKIHFQQIEVPPYLDLAEIRILSYDKIKIQVYEKEIIGYVTYGGNYVYFDKDGIVLDSSTELREEIPLVKGLSFDSMVLYEQLEVENVEVFQSLASLKQLLDKNDLTADMITVTDSLEYNVTFGEILVQLGKDENLDNKIARLKAMLTELDGKSGTLYMEDVDESTERIIFKETTSEDETPGEDVTQNADEEAGSEEYTDSGDVTEGEEYTDSGEWMDSGDETESGEWTDGGDETDSWE